MLILCVEDNRDSAEALRRVLQRRGHTVDIAHSVREAKAKCVDRVYDLWILDVGLPDGHGGDLLRGLRRLTDTPAIALTGYGNPQDVVEGQDDGFDAYLIKPVNLDRLFQTIDEVMARGATLPA